MTLRGRVVYSTGSPGSRQGCAARASAPADHAIRVRRERGGRRGKTVTVAGPFLLDRADAVNLLRALKRRCGSGGALKLVDDDHGRPVLQLELQGDHVEVVLTFLAERGFPSKRSGG